MAINVYTAEGILLDITVGTECSKYNTPSNSHITHFEISAKRGAQVHAVESDDDSVIFQLAGDLEFDDLIKCLRQSADLLEKQYKQKPEGYVPMASERQIKYIKSLAKKKKRTDISYEGMTYKEANELIRELK